MKFPIHQAPLRIDTSALQLGEEVRCAYVGFKRDCIRFLVAGVHIVMASRNPVGTSAIAGVGAAA